ncbi:MAG: malto-oligosyltrehalose synthase [Cyanobacteria bacterium J06626_6]
MRIPIATYRLQFTPSFGFEQALDILDYLEQLGISDVYASPIFKACSGSQHGYDVVDQNQLNPELGGEEKFESLIQTVRDRNMGWLQDTVPNHMAYDRQNPYLMDVFEHGEKSRYIATFDIDWSHGDIRGQVLAPMLGDTYERCLERGELQLSYDQQGLGINYYGLRFPISLASYPDFFGYGIDRLGDASGGELRAILNKIEQSLPDLAGEQRAEKSVEIKEQLRSHYGSSPDIRAHIEKNIQTFNQEAGDTSGFAHLDKLLKQQFYQLAFWKAAAETLNYRRFFTVNELICLNAQYPDVFDQTHSLIQRLINEDKITGLRVDHIDGLYDPLAYLTRLKQATDGTYILVEKILEAEESLPQRWPIEGTSGYEFLTCVNRVFCQSKNEDAFSSLYRHFTGLADDYEALFLQKKRLLADTDLAGDLKNLSEALLAIVSRLGGEQLPAEGLAQALKEVMICFPVYRTYVDGSYLDGKGAEGNCDRTIDCRYIQAAIAQAKKHLPNRYSELNLIEKLLTVEGAAGMSGELRSQVLQFSMRAQQFTGPLMAKGIEDTLFYVYNRLVGLNEVGGVPGDFGLSLQAFHDYHQHQQRHWPNNLNASSTHDTKRSEDVRSRLSVLSEIPQEWTDQVNHWKALNTPKKTSGHQGPIPDANDEYFLYQTLVGAYPFDPQELPDFLDRVKAYAIKAGREAKVKTNWVQPNEEYERGFTSFIETLLSPAEDNAFLNSLQTFQHRIAKYGIYNALSQLLIKLTAPGIPDFYQGSEIWDLSLVDPDNRRSVQYVQRIQILEEIKTAWEKDSKHLLKALLQSAENGHIKLFLTHRMLAARKHFQDLFNKGEYIALAVTGQHSERVIAFERRLEGSRVVVIAPRFFTGLVASDALPIGTTVWGDTAVKLQLDKQTIWKNWLTNSSVASDKGILVGEACASFPVAFLSTEVQLG